MRWWTRGLADVLCVDVLACRRGWWWMLVVDVHECKKKKKKRNILNGWWMRMVTDTDVADSAHAQDLDNFVRVYAATMHY